MNLFRRIVKYVVTGISLLISTPLIFAGNLALPSGWRAPLNLELNDDWRNIDPDKYSVIKGDFNGDGVEDEARLLLSTQRHDVGLFVFCLKKIAPSKLI